MSKPNQENLMDPMWNRHMKTLTERKKRIEISETLAQAITEWYNERGLPEPSWKPTEETWWIEYNRSLNNDNT